MVNKTSQQRIQHLDGLRGFAILSVILFHSFSRWNALEPWGVENFTKTLFENGWLGVELFFFISGFVIFWSLDKCSTFTEFFVKRWLRLFPSMLIGSLFIYSTAFLIPERPLGLPLIQDFVSGITFIEPVLLSKISGLEFKSLDEAFWSLYVEVKFYFLAASSYFLLKDKRGAVLFTIYALFIFLSVFDLFVFSEFWVVSVFLKILRFVGVNYYGWFLTGIFFYMHWKSGRIVNLAMSIFCGVLAVGETGYDKDYSVVLLSILILLIFWLSFINERFSRLLSGRFLGWLGFISYPLYLIHQNFVTGFAIEIYRRYDKLPSWTYPILPLSIVLCVSYAIAKIEPLVRSCIVKSFRSTGILKLE